jgi:hypothetical protein
MSYDVLLFIQSISNMDYFRETHWELTAKISINNTENLSPQVCTQTTKTVIIMGSDLPSDTPEVLSLLDFKVSLSDDVYNHLSRQYSSSGDDSASHLNNIIECMKIAPAETCCRVNLLKATVDEVVDAMKSYLATRKSNEVESSGVEYVVQRHATVKDVVTIRGIAEPPERNLFRCSIPPITDSTKGEKFSGEIRRKKGWPLSHRVVIVDRFCAEAVLRGANIFVKGILCADSGIKEGEEVAVGVCLHCRLSISLY